MEMYLFELLDGDNVGCLPYGLQLCVMALGSFGFDLASNAGCLDEPVLVS